MAEGCFFTAYRVHYRLPVVLQLLHVDHQPLHEIVDSFHDHAFWTGLDFRGAMVRHRHGLLDYGSLTCSCILHDLGDQPRSPGRLFIFEDEQLCNGRSAAHFWNRQSDVDGEHSSTHRSKYAAEPCRPEFLQRDQ